MAEFFEIELFLEAEPSNDVVINISCGASNCPGLTRDFRLPWNILAEVYEHYNTKYPTNLSEQDGERHIDKLFVDFTK